MPVLPFRMGSDARVAREEEGFAGAGASWPRPACSDVHIHSLELTQVLAGAPLVIFRDLTLRESGARAIHVDNANVRFVRCHFVDSGAADIDGGAILVSGGGSIDCEECTFSGNSGRRGGALNVEDGTASLLVSAFHDNSASGAGGAIAIDENGAFPPQSAMGRVRLIFISPIH